MDPATPVETAGSIVAAQFGDFTEVLLANAPTLIGIGLVVFAVPFLWRWAKGLVS
jgi:ABC-type phosphate transport system permease subunit